MSRNRIEISKSQGYGQFDSAQEYLLDEKLSFTEAHELLLKLKDSLNKSYKIKLIWEEIGVVIG